MTNTSKTATEYLRELLDSKELTRADRLDAILALARLEQNLPLGDGPIRKQRSKAAHVSQDDKDRLAKEQDALSKFFPSVAENVEPIPEKGW